MERRVGRWKLGAIDTEHIPVRLNFADQSAANEPFEFAGVVRLPIGKHGSLLFGARIVRVGPRRTFVPDQRRKLVRLQ